MSEVRQDLLKAKKEIEAKSGKKFSTEYLALADLISEFVAIKCADQMKRLTPVVSEPPKVQEVAKPTDDFLYGNS